MTASHELRNWALGVLMVGAWAAPEAWAQTPSRDNPPPGPSNNPSTSQQQGAAQNRVPGRLLLGDRGPDFELAGDGDQKVRLRDYREREAVVLVFQQKLAGALPSYAAAGDTLARRGVRLVLVTRESAPGPGTWRSAAPVLYDRWGEAARIYGAFDPITRDTVPGMFVLDRDGYVRFISVGYLPGATGLIEIVDGLLAEGRIAPVGS